MYKKLLIVLIPFAVVAMEPAQAPAAGAGKRSRQEKEQWERRVKMRTGDVLVIKDTENGQEFLLAKTALPLSRFIQGVYNFNRQHGKAEKPIVLDLTHANLKPAHLGDVIAMLNQLSEPEGPEKVRANLNRIFGQLSYEQLVEEVYIAHYLQAQQIIELLAYFIVQKFIAMHIPAIEVAQQLRNMPPAVREWVAQEYREHLKQISSWQTQRILAVPARTVYSAAYSPDSKYIVTASDDKDARIYDAQTGALVHTLAGHTDWVGSANYSPDGKHIVTASYDKTAKIWDTQTGREVHTLTGHRGGVTSAAYSPDGKHIVTASGDETAKIWDAQTGREVHTLTGHAEGVNAAAYSPDGNSIVTVSGDETAKIWDVQTRTLLRTLTGHAAEVLSATYSPDGKRIVTASFDDTACIWDAQTGTLLHTLTGHAAEVLSAAYSPDDKHIVTASFDNTARTWDTQTGREVHTLRGHTDDVNSAVYSPDGKQIVTASSDSTARIWYQPVVEAFITELNTPDVGSVRRGIWSAQQKAAQRKERRAAARHDTSGTAVISQ